MTRHFLSGDAQARFTADRIEAITAIGRLAEAEGCSFVVVSGDVFESNQVERPVVVRALEAMKATPAVVFYLLPGNHDPLDATSIFRSKTFRDHCPPNVITLEGGAEIPAADGITIVSAPWPNKRPLTDLVTAAVASRPADGTLRVVVGHGAVDTLSPNPNDPALIRLADVEAALADGRIHYVALGDRHSTTSVGTTGRVWYAGAPEPTDYREVDPGHALVVDLSHESVSVVPHRIGRWEFQHRQFDLAGRPDCDGVQQFLEAIVDKPRTIVKLTLVGQLSLADMAHLEATFRHASDLLGALERWERHSELVVLPAENELADLGLSGFALVALEDLKDRANRSDEGAEVARDALGLLYRLAGSV